MKRFDLISVDRHLLVAVVICLSVLVLPVRAQDNIEEEAVPEPETEIVCFAAQKKWVCAPADEKEKAHQKAMQMVVADKQQDAVIETPTGVAIQTMDFNPIKPAAEESPTLAGVTPQELINQQIKDFIPKQDVPATDQGAVNSTPPNTQSAEPPSQATTVTSEAAATADRQTIKTVDNPLHDSAKPSSKNFNDWQKDHGEQWSIQVVGTSNRHHIDQFINVQGLKEWPHSIVKTQINGADWWVVLVGLYTSRDQARSERKQLPAEIAENAWVRQIKTIEGEAG